MRGAFQDPNVARLADGPRRVVGLDGLIRQRVVQLGLGSPGGVSPAVGSAVVLEPTFMPPVEIVNANPPDVKYVKIPEGERGTVATLKVMKKLVMGPWGARNPEVVRVAREIVRHVGSKDYREEADAIFRYVKANVRYRLDPVALEWIQTPLYTLMSQQGDCDDHSMLVAALAMAVGHRGAFRTVKGDPTRPDSWSHVYGVIGVSHGADTEWFSADTTQNQATLGWDPPAEKLFGTATWVIDPDVVEEDRQWL